MKDIPATREELERPEFEVWAKEQWGQLASVPDNAWLGWMGRARLQEGDTYEELWNALQRIDSAAVFLPGFEVKHTGGIEAFTRNIVEAILRCAKE